jgi:cytoskeletal protein RodZ
VARSTGGKKMSSIDVVIPAIIGLVALIWPKVMFAGSSVTADAKKIRLIRAVGVVLLAAATIYLAVKLVA